MSNAALIKMAQQLHDLKKAHRKSRKQVKALVAAQPQWISVEDRLPDETTRIVLVWSASQYKPFVGRRYENTFEEHQIGICTPRIIPDTTHWQLIKPPEDE